MQCNDVVWCDVMGTYPNKPRIDCSKHERTIITRFRNARHMIKQPSEFGGTKVRRDWQATLLLQVVGIVVCLLDQLFARTAVARVVPN
jgi:hypothetical protein